MNAATIEKLLARVEALPRLPESALRVMAVLRDPEAPMARIVEAVRFDQTMTTELLRLCNSAHYARSRKVASVDQAIVVLGARRVMQLVLTAHTRSLLAAEQHGYGLGPGALWRHSIAVASACDHLGAQMPAERRGALFTAGLLHDMGKIVLNEAMSRHYGAIAARVARERIPFSQAERDVLGFTHAQLGAALARCWGLPEPIVRCIHYHHEPAAAGEPDPLVDRVHVADVACLLMGIGGGDDGTRYRADPLALRRIGLSAADLERLGMHAALAVKQVQAAYAASAA